MGVRPDITAYNTSLSALHAAALKGPQELPAIAAQAAGLLQKMRSGVGARSRQSHVWLSHGDKMSCSNWQ
jgi:hypothetical protein